MTMGELIGKEVDLLPKSLCKNNVKGVGRRALASPSRLVYGIWNACYLLSWMEKERAI